MSLSRNPELVVSSFQQEDYYNNVIINNNLKFILFNLQFKNILHNSRWQIWTAVRYRSSSQQQGDEEGEKFPRLPHKIAQFGEFELEKTLFSVFYDKFLIIWRLFINSAYIMYYIILIFYLCKKLCVRVSLWRTCLFAYRVRKWDLITGGSSKMRVEMPNAWRAFPLWLDHTLLSHVCTRNTEPHSCSTLRIQHM